MDVQLKYNKFATLIYLDLYFWIKYDLDRRTTHPKFDPTGVQTHDLQIMTVHFMSLIMRRLL